MRGAHIIVILLAVGLLVFGCTTPTPPADSGAQGGAGAQSQSQEQGSSGQGAQEQTSDQEQTQEQEQEQTQEQEQEQEQTGAEDLAGKTYEALAAMGVPLECDMRLSGEGETIDMKLYMRGSGEMRMESENPSGEPCNPVITIVKGGKTYVGCGGGIYMLDCAWLSFAPSDYEGSGEPSGTDYSAPDPSDVPPVDIDCRPWIYDASKLATPGKVCDMDNLMQGYQQGGYPDGYD